ncbi:hypothetical protein CPC08DRAFT_717744 [Agrocybe pediades]|nr:hypothetical protein CPC08DRAFT_717744 [Agrocybe pediades]
MSLCLIKRGMRPGFIIYKRKRLPIKKYLYTPTTSTTPVIFLPSSTENRFVYRSTVQTL